MVVKTAPANSVGIPGKQLRGKAGWDDRADRATLEVSPRFSPISPEPHHFPSSQPRHITRTAFGSKKRFSGCAATLKRRELTTGGDVLFGGISHEDTFSWGRVLLRRWLLLFVLIGVKWVELSKFESSHCIWLPDKNLVSVGTIFPRRCSRTAQRPAKGGRLCRRLSRSGFPSVCTADHKHLINDCNQIQINVFNRPIFSRLILKKLYKMIPACT